VTLWAVPACSDVAPQGGGGFFNEVLNGLAKHRHLAPACIRPKSRVGSAPGRTTSCRGGARSAPQCPLRPRLGDPDAEGLHYGVSGCGAGHKGGLREGTIPVAATRSDPTMLRDYVMDAREGTHAAHGTVQHTGCQGHTRADGKGGTTEGARTWAPSL